MILPDLSDDSPAGENLELDPDFDALERAARGRPETQYGDTINPAIGPDWSETVSVAERLLERTRDLRVMTHLAVARLHLSGLPAFAEMLAQIRHQLENRWEQVHPQLDPEDGNDPILRSNALFRLQDPANVLRTLRAMPLAVSSKTGPITWRDYAVFNGQVDPEPGRDKPSEAFMRGAFQETNQDRLAALHDAVNQAVHEVAAIPAAFELQAGTGTGPDLTNLAKLLNDIRSALKRFEVIVVDEPASVPDSVEQTAQETPVVPPARIPRNTPIGVRSVGAVESREDALYCLELASAYFRAHEPSSPVPLLLDRASRLASMEFLDILRDLAPDGLMQAQNVAGQPTE
jgi:type VI secretion system protein ImpA